MRNAPRQFINRRIDTFNVFWYPFFQDGEFLGSVVWTENDSLAYIALYIVRPDFRGLGIG